MDIRLIPIDKIIIKGRVRGIECLDDDQFIALKQSIQDKGLLNPLTVTDKFELIAGFRRFNACKEIGLESVPCSIRKDKGKADKLLLEYIENKDRKDFTWQEDIKAKGKLFELLKKNKPKLTIKEFAEKFIHQTKAMLSHDLTVFKYGLDNESIYNFSAKRLAYEHIVRERAAQVSAALIEYEESVTGTPLGESKTKLTVPILYNSAEEMLDTLPEQSVDICVTDPPYGIKVERSGGKVIFKETSYDDSWKECSEMFNNIIPRLRRVMQPGAHVYTFCDFRFAHLVQTLYRSHGFSVCPTPIIWFKLGLKIAANASYYPMRQHEYCILSFAPGELRKLIKTGKSDVIPIPIVHAKDRTHPLEKPVELYADLIQRSAEAGDTFIDPFCGTGNSLIAGAELGLVCHGAEIEEEYRNIAKLKVKEVE